MRYQIVEIWEDENNKSHSVISGRDFSSLPAVVDAVAEFLADPELVKDGSEYRVYQIRDMRDGGFKMQFFPDGSVESFDLRSARNAAGLTQASAADQLMIPKRTIENWETGKSSPPPYVERLVLREYDRIIENKLRGIEPSPFKS